MKVRKTILIRETVNADRFGKSCNPINRIAMLAIVNNPFAGKFAEDLSPLFDLGGQLGEQLMSEAVQFLPGPAVSYGKAAIVGTNGDMEHGGAMIHPRLGKPIRAAIGGGEALIPSNVKIAPAGTPIDIPLGHKGKGMVI